MLWEMFAVVAEAHHFCQSSSCYHIPRVHQSIKVASALLDLLPHVVVDFHVEDIGHEVECILVVLHFCVQSSQVEAICEVVLVDFAEVFIAACRYKLRYGQHMFSQEFVTFTKVLWVLVARLAGSELVVLWASAVRFTVHPFARLDTRKWNDSRGHSPLWISQSDARLNFEPEPSCIDPASPVTPSDSPIQQPI